MTWEAPMPDVMLEFLNTFVIKGTYIYFRHKNKVYVISKQLIITIFGICVEGYVEECEEFLHTLTVKICTHKEPGWKWNYYVVVV
jgi:hypothetical protein